MTPPASAQKEKKKKKDSNAPADTHTTIPMPDEQQIDYKFQKCWGPGSSATLTVCAKPMPMMLSSSAHSGRLPSSVGPTFCPVPIATRAHAAGAPRPREHLHQSERGSRVGMLSVGFQRDGGRPANDCSRANYPRVREAQRSLANRAQSHIRSSGCATHYYAAAATSRSGEHTATSAKQTSHLLNAQLPAAMARSSSVLRTTTCRQSAIGALPLRCHSLQSASKAW